MDIQELYDRENLSYKEYVAYLKDKHGDVVDDYYRENSYNRFLKGEITLPCKGEYSRTGEGLVTHHIKEDEYLNLSNTECIKDFRYPFELQAKANLAYANLVEHTWLHVLIAEETHCRLGLPGLKAYLLPDIEKYYIYKEIPQIEWKLNVYNKAYLSKEEAQNFIEFIKKRLLLSEEFLSPEEKFNKVFPNLVRAGINKSIPRETILKQLYKNSYEQGFPDYKEFKKSKINTQRASLLIELDKMYE